MAGSFETFQGMTETHVVQFLDDLLVEASRLGVSDLHFEPYETVCRVRFRLDGLLYERANLSSHFSTQLIARLKVMAHLDIAERRLPQDGRFRSHLLKDQPIDCRISTCPTLFGEKVVVRLLDPKTMPLDIEALGLEPFQKDLFLKTLAKPQGMILVTGPTGSGKTLTLYTAIHLLNNEKRNISTCEDPIEMPLLGINQVAVNPKIGLHFANTLRAFLRQDPDVIMVGEIRDLETAEIACQAAQTGHLVLSSLHTNSAAEAINRLRNMGVPAYNVAHSLSLIIAQRLVRTLCPHCKIEEKSCLSTVPFPRFTSTGCNKCQAGFKGRIGIFEMIPWSVEFDTLVLESKGSNVLQETLKNQGFWDLKQAGLKKMQQGKTSQAELERVLR